MHSNMISLQEGVNFIFSNLLSLFLPLLLLFIFYKWIERNLNGEKNPPRSPPRLPIIGNLHQLGTYPHRTLKTLAEKYGDLMLLRLGSKPFIVVSSAQIASQMLRAHDVVFASRPQSGLFARLLNDGKDMAAAPYGEYWRRMRSVCVAHLLSNTRVRFFREEREEEVALMVERVRSSPSKVNLSDLFLCFSNDLICRVVLGKKLGGDGLSREFGRLVHEFTQLLGGFFVGEFVSWLAWVDRLSGMEGRVRKVVSSFDGLLERVIEEHLKDAKEESNKEDKDFVDVLLELQKDDGKGGLGLDRDSIKGLLLDMFIGGTDTTSNALQWIMSELLRNPTAMKALQTEVRASALGGDKAILTETDLETMTYLKAVVKETLRLHPPAPLLPPRECTADVRLDGRDIAAGTQATVNIWSVGRDPRYWENPNEFCPERFMDCGVEFRGSDFELIPFGSGRRICPGMYFATASIELAVANLVRRFDWRLPVVEGKVVEVHMEEAPGMGVARKHPLVAVASWCEN